MGAATTPHAEGFLCFRTSEVSCCLTTSSAGIVFSRAAGTRESSCSTHTPASTGDTGRGEVQDGSGLLGGVIPRPKALFSALLPHLTFKAR